MRKSGARDKSESSDSRRGGPQAAYQSLQMIPQCGPKVHDPHRRNLVTQRDTCESPPVSLMMKIAMMEIETGSTSKEMGAQRSDSFR